MNVSRMLAGAIAGAAVGLGMLLGQPAQAGLVGGGGNTVNALFFFGSHTAADQEPEDYFNGTTYVVGPAPIPSPIPSVVPPPIPPPMAADVVYFINGALSDSTIEVTDTSITITNLSPAPFCTVTTTPCPDSFTGFEFQFSPGVDITGVTAGGANAFQPIAGGLSFTATDILVNVTGDAPNPGDQLVLNLTFPQPPPIPEPASLLLLGAGLIGIAVTRRGRVRRPEGEHG